jgi:hypothetical protein
VVLHPDRSLVLRHPCLLRNDPFGSFPAFFALHSSIKSRRQSGSQRRSQHGREHQEPLSSPEVLTDTSDHLQDLVPLPTSTTLGSVVRSDETDPIQHESSVALDVSFTENISPGPPIIPPHQFDFHVGPSQNVFTGGSNISIYPQVPNEYEGLNTDPSSFSQNQSHASLWPQSWTPQNCSADPINDRTGQEVEFNPCRLYASSNYDANDLYHHQQ